MAQEVGQDLLVESITCCDLLETTAGQPKIFDAVLKMQANESISVGEVSEACHGRRIRQELSEPSAVSSLYVQR